MKEGKQQRPSAHLLLVAVLAYGATTVSAASSQGEYLFHAAGCFGCHTDADNEGEPLAGGRAFETPYGVFYSPNITPDSRFGIGSWNLDQFRHALRHGEAPDGSHYFPVFPYPSYTLITDQDIAALWDYLQTQLPVAQPNLDHQLQFPFRYRILMLGWKWLFHRPGAFQPEPARSKEWNRGAYLVRALSHCGECHTPRNLAGALDHSRELAGSLTGVDGDAVPNITPDNETGVGYWSDGDLQTLLENGMLPDGDFVGSTMAEVVDNSLAHLTDEDRRAMIAYLRSIPPVHNPVKTSDEEEDSEDEW